MKNPLILWGGVDIDSKLYGEPRSKFAQPPNRKRDEEEVHQITEAIEKQIPIIGICRGAQLLCAFHGGKLYQHSKPTHQDHSLVTDDGVFFQHVSAGHHQIMNPKLTEGAYILATNPEEVEVWTDDNTVVKMKNTAEIVYYPKYNHIAIQPHPEWARKGDKFVSWLNYHLMQFNINYSF